MSSKHLEYLYSLNRYEIKPGLERMEVAMEALGHPERQFRSIHISGTNGKGSVAAMMEAVLRHSNLSSRESSHFAKFEAQPSTRPSRTRRYGEGEAQAVTKKLANASGEAAKQAPALPGLGAASGKIRTGLYTSPDIYSYNERIRVGGVAISDDDLAELVWELKEICEREGIPLTFFEFGTALAYMYFAREGVDLAVIEVGMGGLLDATNVITPELSIITNIGLDHQEFLGETKEEIAREKAGIIKPGVPVVTAERSRSVLDVIKHAAERNNAKIFYVSDHVATRVAELGLTGQKVRVSGKWDGKLFLPLLGAHQVENLQTALVGLSLLKDELRWPDIRRGIQNTRWEGRLDVVSEQPLTIVDGAHNVEGVATLAAFMKDIKRKDVLVLGLKKGRDVKPFTELAQQFSKVVVTEGTFMPEAAEKVARRLEYSDVHIALTVSDALSEARRLSPDGTVLITGSLYLVADALAVLRSKMALPLSERQKRTTISA